MHLGAGSIELNVARILWAFDVGAARDEKTGEEIPVDIFAYSDGFNSVPLPFRCTIRPRTASHVEVIEREWKKALEELRVYDVVDGSGSSQACT